MLLLVHAAATWFMAGLIWFVQVVHYPLFADVGQGSDRYAARHQRRTGWVVGPPMLIELGTVVWLVASPPPGLGAAAWLGAALLAGIWASTALLQVPAHRELLAGHAPRTVARLVHSNWLRTGLWSARGVLAAWMLAAA